MNAPAVVVVATPDICQCCGSEPERGERFRLVCSTCFEQLVNLTQQPTPKAPRLLSVRETARAMGIREATVRSLIRRGDLRAVQIAAGATPNGTRYRIKRSELARFLAARATNPSHEH